MYQTREECKLPPNEKIKILSNFRRQVLKNRISQFFNGKFEKDPRDFIPLSTECAISSEPLNVPIRNQCCTKPECVFNIETLIQQFSDDICLQQFKCRVCGQSSFNTKGFFFDASSSYYLNEARNHYEDFENKILSQEIFFGVNKKKGYSYCIKEGKNMISLHNLQDKQGHSKVKLKFQQQYDDQTQQSQKEFELITDKMLGHIKQQADFYQSQDLHQNLDVNVNQFMNEIAQSFQQNIQIKSNQNTSLFYKNQFCFCVDIDVNKQQDIVYIYVPFQNKWYKTILTSQEDPKKPFKHTEFTSFCKHYDSQTKQHSIMIIGGQDNINKSRFFNRFLQIPLFKNDPSEIKPQTQVQKLPDMPKEKAMVNCISYNDNVYVLGGFQRFANSSFPTAVNSCEMFNFQTKSWTSIQSMPKPTILLNMVRQENKLYMIGGYDEENQQAKKTQNRSLFILDFNSNQFQIQENVLPSFDHLQDEGVKYFRGKGMAFMKKLDQTICVFGGRNLEDCNFENNKAHSKRRYFMSEYHIPSQIWCINNTVLEKCEEKNGQIQRDNNIDLYDKYCVDLEPVVFQDRVHFAYFSQYPKLAVYDEFAEIKLRQHTFESLGKNK